MTLPVSALKSKLITLTVMLSTIMQTLDSTIANVALPHMQGALNAAQDQISWPPSCAALRNRYRRS